MRGALTTDARWAAARTAATLYAAVAAGSVLGALLRWLAGLAATALFGAALPVGTLFVNVTGSFAIGFFARLSGPDGRLFVGPRLRQLVMTGLFGGYTTFSLFSLETLRLAERGEMIGALAYIALSLVTWLAAVWAGDALAIRLNRLKGAKG